MNLFSLMKMSRQLFSLKCKSPYLWSTQTLLLKSTTNNRKRIKNSKKKWDSNKKEIIKDLREIITMIAIITTHQVNHKDSNTKKEALTEREVIIIRTEKKTNMTIVEERSSKITLILKLISLNSLTQHAKREKIIELWLIQPKILISKMWGQLLNNQTQDSQKLDRMIITKILKNKTISKVTEKLAIMTKTTIR